MPLIKKMVKVKLRKKFTEVDLAEAYLFLLRLREVHDAFVRLRSAMPEHMWEMCGLTETENDATIKWKALVKEFKITWADRPSYLRGTNENLETEDQ